MKQDLETIKDFEARFKEINEQANDRKRTIAVEFEEWAESHLRGKEISRELREAARDLNDEVNVDSFWLPSFLDC